jgi:hypothetical protein
MPMPFGKWKGQAIDTSIKRPAQLLEEDEKHILFANFGHDGNFHNARIPLDGVENVFFRINRFSSNGIAHTLLYIKMKPGSEVILGAIKNAENFTAPTRISEFIVSLDYTAPAGIKYKIGQSIEPNYMGVIDFRSASQYASRGEDPHHLVEYLKLNLDEKEKSRILRNAVHFSHERQFKYAYNLVDDNCTTFAFELLDASVNYPLMVKPMVMSLKYWRNLIAGPSEQALYQRGLIRLNPNGSPPRIWAKKDGYLPSGH